MRKDAIICDCSSIAPAASIELNKAFAAKGAHFLDSPVTGSTGGAEKATLTFMIGGDKAVFERAKPYMEIMGKLFYYCGAGRPGPESQGHPEPGRRQHHAMPSPKAWCWRPRPASPPS